MKAIRVHKPGGPEALSYENVAIPSPRANEALVKIEAIGVNYIDTYHRLGIYKLEPPFTPGMEAAGVVVEVGPEVSEVAAGDRVAYAGVLGAYAEYAAVPATRLVKLPAKIDAQSAAAVMLQGMTAHYLLFSTYPVKPGDTVLIHAAAGGVGLLMVQIAKLLGARVFGTVSTREKAELARQAGADEAIIYTEKDFAAEAKRLTAGRGVQVVYDSVGKDTYEKSMDCLAPRGYLVLFGQSSGPVPPLDPQILSQKGSLFLTRPTLAHYTATREELLQRAGQVLDWVAAGRLKLLIHKTFPLAEAAEAHRQLESRATTGKLLLLPG